MTRISLLVFACLSCLLSSALVAKSTGKEFTPNYTKKGSLCSLTKVGDRDGLIKALKTDKNLVKNGKRYYIESFYHQVHCSSSQINDRLLHVTVDRADFTTFDALLKHMYFRAYKLRDRTLIARIINYKAGDNLVLLKYLQSKIMQEQSAGRKVIVKNLKKMEKVLIAFQKPI